MERQLAHGERDGARAVYNYAEYLPEREKVMQAWANYLDHLRSKVNSTTELGPPSSQALRSESSEVSWLGPSCLDEGEQIVVNLILHCRAQSMRGTLVHLELRIRDELRLERPRIGERHNLIIVTLNDERRDVHALKVFGLIRFGESFDAKVGGGESRHHPLQPKRFTHSVRGLGAGTIVPVERQRQLLKELRTVGLHPGSDAIEDTKRHAAGIAGILHQKRRYGGD